MRVHALYNFSALIRGDITQTNDAVLRFRLGNARLENFRNHAQGIAGADCMWPAQFVDSKTDRALREVQCLNKEPHRHRGRVPAARDQPFENASLRG